MNKRNSQYNLRRQRKLFESMYGPDITFYVIYDEYSQTYNIYTSLTPGIDDILDNADPDTIEEYNSYNQLVSGVDTDYDYVYDRWGDDYNKLALYYILYNTDKRMIMFQTLEGFQYLDYEYPVVAQSNNFEVIVKLYNKLMTQWN